MSSVDYKDVVLKVKGYRVPGKQDTYMCIESGRFQIYSDKVGGEAPSPVEYVLAALVGCYNVVGKIVADELGIRIQEMTIEAEGVFNPQRLYTGEGGRAGFKEIILRVKVKADASKELLDEWLSRVEKRCPVEDNLVNSTPVKATLETL